MDKEDMVTNTAALRKHQETPDSPEDLQCVPSPSLDDIPKEVQRIPSEESALGATTVLKHDIFTNGVLYADLALDMGGVPGELLPLIPLFCRCLTEMGTETESFVELTERIGRKTGGLAATTLVSAKRGSEEPVAYVMLRGKAMQDKSADLFDIARDVLTHGRLDDQQRFLQMVLETKAGQESSIAAGGAFFITRADLMTCGRNILPEPNRSPTTFIPSMSGPSMMCRGRGYSPDVRHASTSGTMNVSIPRIRACSMRFGTGASRQSDFCATFSPPPPAPSPFRRTSVGLHLGSSVPANSSMRSVALEQRFSRTSSTYSNSSGSILS